MQVPLNFQQIVSFMQKHTNDASLRNKKELIRFLKTNEEEILFKILELWDNEQTSELSTFNKPFLLIEHNTMFYSKN